MKTIDSEVIIIGGGPAGSTCAHELNRHGVQTLILDKKRFPRLKLCAGWITPKVVKDLQFSPDDYPYSLLVLNRLFFHFYGMRIPVKTRQYSIRRIEFDDWLLKRSGVPIIQHRVKRIDIKNGDYYIDDRFRCKYLVGAAGTHCPVFRTIFRNINPRSDEYLITAIEEEFPYDYHDDNCHLWFFENHLPGYAWYVPKEGGYLNVGIGGKFKGIKRSGKTIRMHWDNFIKKLKKLSLVTNHAFNPGGYNYYLRQPAEIVQLDNAFIIGDSAGLATLDMGEGIGPAIESGILAAQSIINSVPYSPQTVTKYSSTSFLNIIFSKLSAPKHIKNRS